MNTFDVIIVGGGHAGTEAALAAARMGASTLLLTHNIETLGQMSCNPSIGGIGKSHLVKEIDAMGGVMAKSADRAGIHFRVLNASKGVAVRATRAQSDRVLYRNAIRYFIENQNNLRLFQQGVDDLIVENGHAVGVITQTGLKFYAKSVVLTVGTFLGGCVHIGEKIYSAGRAGDPASNILSKRLRELPFSVKRLKTGTPPRVDKRSINFNVLQEQPTEKILPVFSFVGSVSEHPPQRSCHIARTNERTHAIILENLKRSAIFSGNIEGVGPRYCPSIEDKIIRFSEQSSHQVFIEPEGLDVQEIYPSGISTSLPFEVQKAFVRSINGFENAHITRPGYAIEYDYFDPRDLYPWLETKVMPGLFFAGQINGTTGYEEAAAQGLVAGTNAALLSRGDNHWYPNRSEAYIGVLIDDLITQGVKEPYRMFTSRSEFRLLLREDNADLRLTDTAYALGLIDVKRWEAFSVKRTAIEDTLKKLKTTRDVLNKAYTLYDLLSRPELSYTDVVKDDAELLELSPTVIEQVEIQVKYAGYIERQQQQIEKHRRYENLSIPDSMDYTKLTGLSNEARQVLMDARPKTIGQASRLPGITPAAIAILLVYLKRNYSSF